MAEIDLGSRRVILVKPQTFMNLSGRAAVAVHGRFDNSPGETVVVVDDLALPLGTIRLRKKGSDGGHNGLRSIATEWGTTDFPRLRLGIGAAPAGEDPADYVLERFGAAELHFVGEMVARACRCLEAIVLQGLDRAMGEFNTSPADGETG
jgi:PTH1 family peptidyl-tRNA hydrolase